jgi:Domain of unknown function (DUF4304)
MQARLIFYDYLKSEFFPKLASLGFAGAEPTYRRVRGEVISILHIQEHRGGDRCCIDLGLHLDFLPASWARHSLNIDKLTVADCEFRWRLSPPHKHDFWWRYQRWFHSPVRCASHLVETYLEQGEGHFERFRSADEIAALFTPQDFESGAWLKASDSVRPQRGALTMARILLHLGRLAEAKAFAQAGIGLISPATALAAEYLNILKAA